MASHTGSSRIEGSAKIIVGIVIGSIVAVAAIVVTLVLTQKNSNLDKATLVSLSTMKEKVSNKDAINCLIHKDDISQTVQTNKGWSKFLIDIKGDKILVVEGDGIYQWNKEGGRKTPYDSAIPDAMAKGIADLDEKNSDNISFACSDADNVNFDIPKDIPFSVWSESELVEN